MNVKTLEEIDFFRIREVVADYCITTEGKNNFLQKLPISDSEQIDFFKRQLNLAKELNLPVIIHDRDAHGDMHLLPAVLR